MNYDFQIPGHAFVGLENFRDIVSDPIARRSLVNTAILAAASVAVEFVLGLMLALAMVDHFRGRGLIMSILIVPLFISPVIVGQFWSLLLQQPFGPTNYLLGLLLGRAGRDQLADPDALELHRDHHRRRLAVDAVHVRDPALGPHARSRPSCSRRPSSTAPRAGRPSST